MRASDRVAGIVIVGALACGCLGDTYELGALDDMGSGGATADDEAGDLETDPFAGAEVLKPFEVTFKQAGAAQWSPEKHALFVADVGDDVVLVVDPVAATPWLAPAGRPGGLAIAGDGSLLVSQSDAGAIVRANGDGTSESIASGLSRPRALVVDSDARAWVVTDEGIVRVDADGTATVVATDAGDASGVALSPAQDVLYVVDRSTASVLAHAIDAAGSLGSASVLASVPATLAGACVDELGNLLVTSDAGVHAFAADGTPWSTLDVPGVATDCTFDGERLHIVTATTAYVIRLQVGGPP